MLSVLLDSWDRQAKIIDNLFDLVTEDLKNAKPSEDGMPIYEQFAHVHNTRRFWLSRFSPNCPRQTTPATTSKGAAWFASCALWRPFQR